MGKNSLKNVESENNKILYETLLDFLQRNGTYFLNKPCTHTLTHTHTHTHISSNSYTLLRRGTCSSVCIIQPTKRSR